MMFFECIHAHSHTKRGPYNSQGQCCVSEYLRLTVLVLMDGVCVLYVQMLSEYKLNQGLCSILVTQ